MPLTTVRSRRTLLVAAIVAVVLLLVVAVAAIRSRTRATEEGTSGTSPGTTASSSPGVSASASPSESASSAHTEPAPPLSQDEAAATTRDALTRTAAALSDPGNPADLSGVLTDGELDSYEAQADEFASTGVHQNGAPTIENPGIVGVSDDGATVSVQACVDSSSVHVLDDQGTDLHASQPKRSLTIFMLTNSNGSWKISGESFPDDPTC